MATFLLSNAKVFLPSSSTLHTQPQQTVCRAAPSNEPPSSIAVTSRRSISLSLTSAAAALLLAANYKADAAILEADDDEELLEKVKRDRKKRLDRQGVINSSTKETALLQDAVYKLSKIGQALESNNLSEASSVLGSSNTEWLQKVNSALDKLSYGEEEKTEADIFNSSLASLISSISQNDVEASKIAFVTSATAFEKWTTLSGLSERLKGL
ncbi:chloroplast thylakoid lumen protein [Perilla frutescens var. hirtella]|uniref:Chloroplast thylakoid lumen protein n=1 Tax=Perilla frutescens var. hirtella TaxID=608512 RepID=A0AAD4P7Y7_PERFH|nr:chloroplast thylakoid lumen protein [Perilla frutescens var. hirtella]